MTVQVPTQFGPLARLDLSGKTVGEWPMHVPTGPLGLHITALPGAKDSFMFRGSRLRGVRCVFTSATVNGCELRRPARQHAGPADNTTQVLIRIAAPGYVTDEDAHFRGAIMKVIGAGREVCEEFPANSHICTLNVQHSALAISPEALAAMTDHDYVITAMQSALLRAAVAVTTEGEGAEIGRNIAAVDRFLSSVATLLLRTAVLCRPDEPERLGSVRNRTEALIFAHAADPLLTPATLATQLSVSLRQLYRAFDGTESPAARIRRRRLEMAAELLSSHGVVSSVDAVAQQCGFVSSEYFSRAFRREYGLSPRAYRGAHRDGVHVPDARVR